MAALLMGFATVEAAVGLGFLFVRRRLSIDSKQELRLSPGLWLTLALEFEIAADNPRRQIHFLRLRPSEPVRAHD